MKKINRPRVPKTKILRRFKMSEERKLTESQLELIKLKQQLINQTLQQFQNDWNATIEMIARELGINNLSEWQFTGTSFIYTKKEVSNESTKNADPKTN